MEQKEELYTNNLAVLNVLYDVGSSLASTIRASKLIDKPIANDNTVFENIFMSRIKDKTNLTLGINKPKEN